MTRPRARFASITLCLALLGSAGCDPKQIDPKTPPNAQHALPAIEVTDADFAVAVHRLLRTDTASPERSALLAGTVRRQLSHAAEHFKHGEEHRGTSAVVGALYLMQIGDPRRDMFDDDSAKALSGAMAKFSARGDEGRALALMLLQASLLARGSPESGELQQHLEALQSWMVDTRTGGDMVRLAADERAAVARALLEPTEETLEAAAVAVDKWIARAVQYNLEFQETRQLPPREEAQEAFNALRSGSTTMAAIYLRYGRAQAALARIEGSEARRIVPMEFFARLRAAAVDNTAEDWRLLAREFARARYEDREDMPHDEALLDAALWGVSLEAYRRDPTSQAVAHILADRLVDFGLPEAAPLVLSDALGDRPSVVSLSAAMVVVAEALGEEYDSGGVSAARRIFAASDRLLTLSDADEYKGRLKPSSSQLRQLMASIELRAGNAAEARPLFLKAVMAEPSVWGLTMLGTLERQMGDKRAALEHAVAAAELPAGSALPLQVAEAKLLAFEILRDDGANDRAQAVLEQALSLTLRNRSGGTTRRQLRAEQVLARVLDGYGEEEQASQAISRALDLAGTHRPMLGPTMLSAIGRALVHKNVVAARAALQTGLKADVDQDSLVYGALWLMLLEAELGEEPDGKVERVLQDAVNDSGSWTGSLARWARGMVDDAALRTSATTFVHHVEAEFYISMRARAKGQAGADKALRDVASKPLLELMEVQLARDILAPRIQAKVPGKYPLP